MQTTPHISTGTYGVLSSPVAAYSGIQDSLSSALLHFLYQHSFYPVYGFTNKQPHLLDSHVVAVQLAWYLYLQLRRTYYSFAFYGHAIYYGQLMSDGPIFLYVLCHIIFLCSQPPYMIYALRTWSCASWAVASCVSYMDEHVARSTIVLIVFMLILRPHNSPSALFMVVVG